MAQRGFLKALLAGVSAAALGMAAPAAFAQDQTPDTTSAQRAATAARAAADEAAKEAAAAAPPATAMLVAPSAPTAPPVLTFTAAPAADPAQNLLGSADAMPVASARLLATLTAERAAPAAPTPSFAPPPAPTPVPAFLPAVAAPTAAEPALLPPAPLLSPPPPSPAPIAPPTVLAALGAAPVKLPSAEALEAAIAAQTTPVAPPATVYAAAPAPAPAPVYVPRARYAAASFASPRSRRSAGTTANARFMRAVVSTAAVSVEMPDVGRQISPLGLLLGQLVTSQETPGTQYGLQEEMTMPTRPRLMAMPEVAVPRSFCSAEQRGAFMEGIYQPAMAIAQHNNEVAAAYVRKLRTLYDNYQLSGDAHAQSAIAAEAKDFARTVTAASSIQDELTGQFEDIMTTPVSTCGASQ